MYFLLTTVVVVLYIIVLNFWSVQPGSHLGKTIDEVRNEENIKSEHKRIIGEINFWQHSSENRPGYRDAYLKLSVLNWQIENNDESKKFLDKVLEIDPNNPTVQNVKAAIVY